MGKTNKKMLGWMLAAGLAIGVTGTGAGNVFPGIVTAYADEKKEVEEPKEQEIETKKVRPSDYVIFPQETYTYNDMGLTFTLPKALLDKMESQEIVMLPAAALTEDESCLEYGFVQWNLMTKEQKETEIAPEDFEAYSEWMEGLERVGTLGVFHKDTIKDLDQLTGCTEHKELGKSEDGLYVYYLSTKEGADEDIVKALGEIKTEIKEMSSYEDQSSGMEGGEALGSFTTEDINGKEYTEKLFEEAELTMVNVFATWCSPCINEIPYLAKLDKNMKEKGVQVVGFVMDAVNGTEKNDEGIEKAKIIAKQTKAEYPFLIPDSGYLNGRIANIQAVPETFFVDKNGNIVGETYSGSRSLEEWEEIVEKELKALSEEES